MKQDEPIEAAILTRGDASGSPSPVEAAIVLADVGMAYDTRSAPADYILADIDLTVGDGEFFVLVGPSGSGKSTLLKLIAGTAIANEGQVLFKGAPVQRPGRQRAMVFQSVDGPLFDWLTVSQNIGFGLEITGMPAAERRAVIAHHVELVGLTGHEHKFPHELSGGMKQRVQIARTLAVEPDVVLMDEPFAALDALTRRVLQREIARIWRETGKTFVYVTHDIREALLLGQRIGVMSVGPRATIRTIHHISMPFPRDETTTTFLEMSARLDAEIEREATRQWEGR